MAWSKQEDKIVSDMWAAGEKIAVIAATLGRSDDQVRWRRETLGLPPRNMISERNMYSKDEDETVIRLWRQGFEAKDIGEALGRTDASVQSRIRRLRKFHPGKLPIRCVRTKPDMYMQALSSIAEIQLIVAQRFMVPARVITGPCRMKSHTKPRFIAMAVARKLTGSSLPKLARAFNRKDHTTVLNGIRQAEHQWPDVVAEIEQKILGLKEAAE